MGCPMCATLYLLLWTCVCGWTCVYGAQNAQNGATQKKDNTETTSEFTADTSMDDENEAAGGAAKPNSEAKLNRQTTLIDAMKGNFRRANTDYERRWDEHYDAPLQHMKTRVQNSLHRFK